MCRTNEQLSRPWRRRSLNSAVLTRSVANAGVGGGSSFAEFPTEQWRKVMAVNLDGVFFTLREACKHMKARAEAGDPGDR